MSMEEEVELGDLVAQTLELNGCLAKIRAQLRASIFLALDEDEKISSQQPLKNTKIKNYLETVDGKTMFLVVREFLEFFGLHFTLSVYEPESYFGSDYQHEERKQLADQLGLENSSIPLLLQLIKIAQTRQKSLEINLDYNDKESEKDEKTSSHDSESTSNLKTDSCSECFDENKFSVDNIQCLVPNERKLNTTFDITSPTVNLNINTIPSAQSQTNKQNNFDSTYCKQDKIDIDEVTGSFGEESDNSPILENSNKVLTAKTTETDLFESTLKDSKPKLSSQKLEKLKPKSSLSSSSDLPPLQLNKSRVNDILPSMYSKEFKDRTNLRELDKLFDMEAEYEEDFMCSGDDLSLKSDYLRADHSKINLLDDLQCAGKTPSMEKSANSNRRELKQTKSQNKGVLDWNKPTFQPVMHNQKNIEHVKVNGGISDSFNSSSSSERFDLNT